MLAAALAPLAFAGGLCSRASVSMVAPTSLESAPTVERRLWDRDAFLRGYENSAELQAQHLACPELPKDLLGTYYRNGHARFVSRDGRKVRHPFDADGMVCAVTLDGRSGTAVVRQRYVASQGAIKERVAGRSLYPGQFGNARPFWDGGANFKNLANTGVMWHGGKLLALWEGSRPHVLDPLSLATMGEYDVEGLVGNGPTDSFSAHPRDTPEGGKANFAFFGNPATGKTKIRFWDFQADSFTLRSTPQTHEVPGFGLYHDFLVTDSWFIVTAAPSTWGSGGFESVRGTLEWIAGKRTVVSMIEFDVTKPTVAYFFPRDERSGAQPVAIELDTFFSFHHANAFEDPSTGEVIFDTVLSEQLAVDDRSLGLEDSDLFIIEQLDYESEVPQTALIRYTIDVSSGQYTKRRLSSRQVEFPSVAPSVRSKEHRYIYCSTAAKAEGVSPYAGVLKVDTQDASLSQFWLPEPHQFCGEAIFVPRSGTTTEDDGYILTLCFDGHEGTSTLLVLDALHLNQGPIARVQIPSGLAMGAGEDATIAGPGHGLHGTWAAGLVPSYDEVRQAESARKAIGARFLSDIVS